MDLPNEKSRIEADPRLKDLVLTALAKSKSGWLPDALNGSMRLSILELAAVLTLVALSPGHLSIGAFLLVASVLLVASIGRTRIWIKPAEEVEARRRLVALSALGGLASGALPLVAENGDGLDPAILIAALLGLASSIHLSSRTSVALSYGIAAYAASGVVAFVLRPDLGTHLLAPMGVSLTLSLVSVLVASRLPRMSVATARQAGPSAQQREHASFIANMSHELRTPLNAIIGFS